MMNKINPELIRAVESLINPETKYSKAERQRIVNIVCNKYSVSFERVNEAFGKAKVKRTCEKHGSYTVPYSKRCPKCALIIKNKLLRTKEDKPVGYSRMIELYLNDTGFRRTSCRNKVVAFCKHDNITVNV